MKKYIADILIITIILIVSLFWIIYNKSGYRDDADSKEINVYVDGDLYGTYRIDIDDTIDIDSEYGHNTLSVKDNKVCMTDSDCDNNSCINMGAISHSYESIICIPNRVVVEISDGNKESIDAIAY